MNSISVPASTTSMPSGLARSLASFATNLVLATPTDATSPVSARTRRRRATAISGAEPCSRRAPPTSRNASSSASGSTSGVTSRRIAITERLPSPSASQPGDRLAHPRVAALDHRGRVGGCDERGFHDDPIGVRHLHLALEVEGTVDLAPHDPSEVRCDRLDLVQRPLPARDAQPRLLFDLAGQAVEQRAVVG